MNKTLMTDFYELTMAQTYFNLHEENKVAYFDIFFRSNPFNGGYAISGGLDAIIDYVLNFKFDDEYIEYLSIGISNLIDIFEPEAVSIGGSFVYFADVLLDKLKNNIQKKKYLFNTRKELIIIPAALGNDAGIIGACQ